MSEDTGEPTRHDNRVETVEGQSAGIVHGDFNQTVINQGRAAPTLADDLERIRAAEVRLAEPPAPTPLGGRSPYPLFRPYEDPAIFAGRDADVAELRAKIGGEHPIVGVCAPSGYGKSSLLRAGLAPTLRQAGHPVVIEHRPADDGLASRLLGGLLEPAPMVEDDDPDRFIGWLRRAVEVSKRPPVLVIDQLEAVFKVGDDEAPRARAALLIAATLRAGLPVRWVLSYRAEFDWQIGEWLDIAHDELARCFPDCAGRLPPLGRARLNRCDVRPFGAVAPADAFREAIARPLRDAKWRIAPSDLDKLTAFFVGARSAHGLWPLVPELQVVLDHRVKAADGRTLTAPADLDADLRHALREHIERVIDRLVRDHRDPRVGRALIGVALRRLVDAHGRRDEVGLTRAELLRTIDAATLEALEGPEARLLMVRRDEGGPDGRYTLSHDTIAAEVATLGGDGWFDALAEAEREALRVVLGFDQRIGNLAALYRDEGTDAALVLALEDIAQITQHCEQLLWDDTRRAWWAAVVARQAECQREVAARRQRAVAAALVVIVVVIAVDYSIWWTDRQAKVDRAVAQIEAGNAVLRNLQDLIDLSDDDAQIDRLIDGAALEVAEDAPDDPVEGARARFIRRRLNGPATPQSAEDFGRLIAAVQAGAHPKTPGRLSADARDALRMSIHLGLRSRFGDSVPEIDWAQVTGGEFVMGDESGTFAGELPRRLVTMEPFYVSRTEVTIGQYASFDGNGYRRSLKREVGIGRALARWGSTAAERPAWAVNWYEAQSFAAWLDPHVRLPTEAEWEYAARGGSSQPESATPWWTGSTPAGLRQVAWIRDNSDNEPKPVCEPPDPYRQHPLGLCDVHGNLMEWVSDWHSDNYERAITWAPQGPRSGTIRVYRGGAFSHDASVARSAARYGHPPATRHPLVGFRLARSK